MRVNVDSYALVDARFELLAHRLNLQHRDHALGQMIRVWNECYSRETPFLSEKIVLQLLGDGGVEALLGSELGTRDTRGIRIAGAEERIQWLKRLRKRNRKNQQKHRSVTGDRDGDTALVTGSPAPAPAPALSPDSPPVSVSQIPTESKPPRRSATLPPYPPGFDQAWKAYPHFGGRSSKPQSARRWKELRLEAHAERVLTWIQALKDTQDWKKDSGSFVPGMQVWLRKPDFSEDPPKPANGAYIEWMPRYA